MCRGLATLQKMAQSSVRKKTLKLKMKENARMKIENDNEKCFNTIRERVFFIYTDEESVERKASRKEREGRARKGA